MLEEIGKIILRMFTVSFETSSMWSVIFVTYLEPIFFCHDGRSRYICLEKLFVCVLVCLLLCIIYETASYETVSCNRFA